jgi:hypothetical protein
MTQRSDDLQLFVDCAFVAFGQFAGAPESRRSILEIFAALERPGMRREGQGSRLPVCQHLDTALAVELGFHRLGD